MHPPTDLAAGAWLCPPRRQPFVAGSRSKWLATELGGTASQTRSPCCPKGSSVPSLQNAESSSNRIRLRQRRWGAARDHLCESPCPRRMRDPQATGGFVPLHAQKSVLRPQPPRLNDTFSSNSVGPDR